MTFAPLMHFEIAPLESEMHLPFHISKGAVEKVENVLLVLRDAEGRTGLGEAAPFPVLTGDTQQIALTAAHDLLSQLQNLSPASALEKLHNTLWKDFRYAPSARTGVEIALWDLHAQQVGCPLWMLWGRAGRAGAHTDITLPCLPPDDVRTFWNHFSKAQFPYVKVKVGGGSVQDDVDRVMTLLACTEPDMTISLDGNQGFTVESTKRLVAELKARHVDPMFFEQPLPEDDFAGMARLCETLPIPVCADESVKTAGDALRIIHDRAAHMINLKFMKSGVRESLLIAELARQFSLPLMIGGMVESEIAMTASLHAVCGTGLIRWCDLDTPFFLKERVTIASPYHNGSAHLMLPQGHGLGLQLSETALSTKSQSRK